MDSCVTAYSRFNVYLFSRLLSDNVVVILCDAMLFKSGCLQILL